MFCFLGFIPSLFVSLFLFVFSFGFSLCSCFIHFLFVWLVESGRLSLVGWFN